MTDKFYRLKANLDITPSVLEEYGDEVNAAIDEYLKNHPNADTVELDIKPVGTGKDFKLVIEAKKGSD